MSEEQIDQVIDTARGLTALLAFPVLGFWQGLFVAGLLGVSTDLGRQTTKDLCRTFLPSPPLGRQ